jgi:hypothetical protein
VILIKIFNFCWKIANKLIYIGVYVESQQAIRPFQDDRGVLNFLREWSRKVHFCLIFPDVIQWEKTSNLTILADLSEQFMRLKSPKFSKLSFLLSQINKLLSSTIIYNLNS